MWVSVSPDLRHDARRDLRDLGAANIPVQGLTQIPNDRAARIREDYPEGVMFCSYSSLTAGASQCYKRHASDLRTRLVLTWSGNLI